jgi:formimidoylglutamate deiminase
MPPLHFESALLPSGWAKDVRVVVSDEIIAKIAADTAPDAGDERHKLAIPGIASLHSHAFQRGMAGLAERRGPSADSFWTWREVMYRFLQRLSPDDVEAIAAFAYMEMLEAGFTAVGEFHYLHHDVDGRPYSDLAEMGKRIVAAAAQTHIGLTLLPSFYAYGGFGGAPPSDGQRRFINDPDRFFDLVARTRIAAAALPAARVGIAPHSLRAVTPATLRAVCQTAPEGPIHIHAAEQAREVEDCVAALGRRPVEWLLENGGLDARWCVVHATHTTEAELKALAASNASVGLCPVTEASLGDGIFDGAGYLAAGGRFGVGTDSNIQIDAASELRQLEYSQRLMWRARNVMTLREGESTGRRLFTSVLAAGAQALQQPIGALAAGARADIVLLDDDHPDLAARSGDSWLDAWVFVAGRSALKSVLMGGEPVVERGHHKMRPMIEARFKKVVADLIEA